ncbi:ATP-sensitive inward rectifier potassium channel 1 [Nothobranchius furzeri]|uniref:Potassium inwardly rectifying channel subfamily J member 1b n=2 Tax=Nothobranchius TaxID=28779 RepID=A0A8C6KVU7_NOTFU|nr:ATP-sensitive inward rectifier potassium channel 1 [Nothobranchius furzeri]
MESMESLRTIFTMFQPTRRRIHKSRLVTKDGHCNIEFGNAESGNHFAFLGDLWTTFIEIRWRFVLLFFVVLSIGSWLVFGLLWYWIAKSNGDLIGQNHTVGHVRCLENVTGFTSAFLYALETQTTVGYGVRMLTDHCASAVALLAIQSLVGVVINCFVCGIILAKISLPKNRAKTVSFSKMATICVKKESLCLLIRVANLRKTLLIGSQIYGKLLRTTTTPDGETIILDQVDVNFSVDAGKDNLFFVCPLTLYHVIDRSSPFYELSADTLPQQDFELVVFLEGTAESTSASCQVRTSYIPQEIQWGYNFLPIISRTKTGKYHVDFSNFSKTFSTITPHCVHCFETDADQRNHNNENHGTQQKTGIDNLGFQVIDIPDTVDVPNM